jgi:hypothetical protein
MNWRRIAIIVCICIGIPGCLNPIIGPSVEVDCASIDFLLNHRLNIWFKYLQIDVPILPKCHEIPLTFYPVNIGATSKGTCDYLSSKREVRFEPGMLDGCIVHEYGHASLDLINHPCWRNFEHGPKAEQECINKLR